MAVAGPGDQTMSLQALVALSEGHTIEKAEPGAKRSSAWAVLPLREEQVWYAADDAWASRTAALAIGVDRLRRYLKSGGRDSLERFKTKYTVNTETKSVEVRGAAELEGGIEWGSDLEVGDISELEGGSGVQAGVHVDEALPPAARPPPHAVAPGHGAQARPGALSRPPARSAQRSKGDFEATLRAGLAQYNAEHPARSHR